MSVTPDPGSTGSAPPPPATPAPESRDRTHFLYIAVIIAVVAGVLVGGLAPDGFGKELKPLGDGFVA